MTFDSSETYLYVTSATNQVLKYNAQTGARLLRFHLSNGAISILGSLLLMRWLVGQMGARVLVANLVTIAACSVGNFLASDRWVFLLPAQAAAKE